MGRTYTERSAVSARRGRTYTAPFEGKRLAPTKKLRYYLVGQSQASAYAEQPASSTSGIRDLETAMEELCEGGYVLDKRHLPWEVACECISGPMSSAVLPPMTMRTVRVVDVLITFPTFDAFFDFLDERKGDLCLSMSYLSMDLYAEWWRRKGAKVGRRIKGEIQWKAPYSGPLFEREV